LGMTTTTLYAYVNGDGSLKQAGQGVCPTFYTWRFFPGCTTHEANCAS